MKIVELKNLDDAPYGELFSSSRWLEVLRGEYDFPFFAVTKTVDVNNLPLLIFSVVEDIFGKRVLSLPFSDYVATGLPEEELRQAVACIISAYPGIPVTLKLLGEHDGLLKSGFAVIRRGFCHRIRLDCPVDDLWGKSSHAFKKGVKKAERSGVSFVVKNNEEGVDQFYHLLTRLRREKYRILPQPKSFYQTLFSRFVQPGYGDICMTMLGDKPVGAAFILRSGNGIYDKMGVSDLDHLDLRPNNLLLWEVMKMGHSRGAQFLDMGLTQADNEGLVRFKESLGGDSEPVTYYRYLPANHDQTGEKHLKALLSKLTGYFVDSAESEAHLQKAAELLYRYFC
jgi:hypothetical protein